MSGGVQRVSRNQIVTFMCYTILHPTPSIVGFDVGELCLVHCVGAQRIPCVDPLACVLTREAHLVVHLLPMHRASLGRVSVLDAKSTQETYVPIRKLLYDV